MDTEYDILLRIEDELKKINERVEREKEMRDIEMGYYVPDMNERRKMHGLPV